MLRVRYLYICFLFGFLPWISLFGQKLGAEQTELYFPLLSSQRIGLVANQSSLIGHTHLLDTLLASGIEVKKIFSPEHGFRGKEEAGKYIEDKKDTKTGIPIISMYGKNKNLSPSFLQDLDIVVFDIQDVGLRFYTYISTLHYVMEACAQAEIKLLILDRPNPHGFYIDGPILEKEEQSFVGMHPVPVVHGLTIGEYAQMINGNYWLKDSLQCSIHIIPIKNYTHQMHYNLPIPPSPNLQNMEAIYAYPSLCFFEGTPISVGRGTPFPFLCFGFPSCPIGDFSFSPKSIKGISENPPYKGQLCKGYLLKDVSASVFEKAAINLDYLIEMYSVYPEKDKFFKPFFHKLAGTKSLAEQIQKGMTAEEIRASWQDGLEKYKKMRKKYLLYEE